MFTSTSDNFLESEVVKDHMYLISIKPSRLITNTEVNALVNIVNIIVNIML